MSRDPGLFCSAKQRIIEPFAHSAWFFRQAGFLPTGDFLNIGISPFYPAAFNGDEKLFNLPSYRSWQPIGLGENPDGIGPGVDYTGRRSQ